LVSDRAESFNADLDNSSPVFFSGAREIVLLRGQRNILFGLVADVAELADALDSKSSIFTDVWVRPPPSAPIFSLPGKEKIAAPK
jgi:hypothetical protein